MVVVLRERVRRGAAVAVPVVTERPLFRSRQPLTTNTMLGQGAVRMVTEKIPFFATPHQRFSLKVITGSAAAREQAGPASATSPLMVGQVGLVEIRSFSMAAVVVVAVPALRKMDKMEQTALRLAERAETPGQSTQRTEAEDPEALTV